MPEWLRPLCRGPITLAAFNGATAFRRWKHEKVVTRVSVQNSWDGLTTTITDFTLQWGHRLSTVETASKSVGNREEIDPSMGPPPFDGGNFRPLCRGPITLAAFNGATAFRRWKPWDGLTTTITDFTLQWGHRLSTVETASKSVGNREEIDPSMGPPPFGVGAGIVLSLEPTVETASERARMTGTEILQWGHRLSTVETGQQECWKS
jgi:hypothetical protein